MKKKPKFSSKPVNKTIEIKPFLEKCCCGSGQQAKLLKHPETGKPFAYMCGACMGQRLKTFGIDAGEQNFK